MKKLMFFLFSLTLWSCSETASVPEPVSTVDSNLAEPNDSILPEMYLNDPNDDSNFNIALDSAGETILPQDTTYVQ